jgi:site-specific recombinase XerD
MKKLSKPNILARSLQTFFADYLHLRGMSSHTIHSYRDCFTLLLRFIAAKKRLGVEKLDIEDLSANYIIAFLQMLEDDRHNSVTTRNVRLAAIHLFFRYLAGEYPKYLEHCQKILAIPFKRACSRLVEYLEYDEIQSVLASVNRTTKDGERDYALLVTMFNTGARVQEILDLKVCDMQLIKPYHVRLLGKGRKERLCPLWSQTADLLQQMLNKRNNVLPNEHIFLNHRGQPLTRFGVRYLFAKYCKIARKNKPTLVSKRLHPHSMRHSTAVHLLKSGVDIVTISHWLGHASINTTNRYASIDLDMKREAISKIELTANSRVKASWHSDASILKWLESL